jgi:MFS family permease
LFVIAQLIFAAGQHSLWRMGVGLAVFFTAFNVLEASLPATISKAAPAHMKGTAIGVYSSIQFLGTFVGAATGGWIAQRFGLPAVFLASALLSCAWWLVAFGAGAAGDEMRYPIPSLAEREVQDLLRKLAALPGVREARVVAQERMAYLRIDRGVFDEQGALRLIKGAN